jgi:hypothetical protein
MSMLIEAIGELIKEERIALSNLKLHYAGTNGEYLLNQATEYGIKEIIHDYGYITREQSLELQRSCDILVVLSWNTNKEQGILTGKFFEYFQVYKPIISITCGNLINAELTQIVKNMNLGISCEYISKDKDVGRLKDYLLVQYNHIIKGEPLNYNPKKNMMESFNYKNLSKKMEEICIDLVEHNYYN